MKRRDFVGALAASGITIPRSAIARTGSKAAAGALPSILRIPDRIAAEVDGRLTPLSRTGDSWSAKDVEVTVDLRERPHACAAVWLSAPRAAVSRIRLRWQAGVPIGSRFLGDHWERSYGDLEWRGIVGERVMPWYVMASNAGETHGYGVRTGAASIAWWQVDVAGITLWLDVRNGGSGVQLGSRRLCAAEIVERRGRAGESTAVATRAFCRVMCAAPRLAPAPVYGSNNWYYAYGANMSDASTMRDADLMAELAPSSSNRPFVVIDMGWSEAPEGAGPVTRLQKGYGDMSQLAARMRRSSIRPGIWTRPLLSSDERARPWRLPAIAGRPDRALTVMDPTIPEAQHAIAESIRTLAGWGFELIKHDYSTYDLLGRWGFEMGIDLTDGGWSFNDRSKTTAEIVGDLYRTIRSAAGDSLLIGCNTIGHLGAGLFELQRIGDDTSGREWSRTRKMGVNTLAFRIAQHDTFFGADADCVAVTDDVPWPLTLEWLKLAARSGTPLFLSPDPAVVRDKHKPALREALAVASKRTAPAEPLDWMETTVPEVWSFGGKVDRFDWYSGE